MTEASVILSTYNREDSLRVCLEALARQTCPPTEFEVVVVIDGSTDGTHQFLENYQTPFPLRVLWQENSGQSVAFNKAIRIASGKIFIFLDDDIRPVPGFVEEHLRAHREQTRAVGIGQLTLSLPSNADWFARRFAEDWRRHYENLNQGRTLPTWQDCYAGNMSVTRGAFEEIEGFSVLPRGNDIEIGYRLNRRGFTFVYIPGACGDQDEQKGYAALVKDAELAGAGCMEVYRRHPATLIDLFGRFSEQRSRIAMILRLLLALDIPPRSLQRFGWLVEKITRSDFAFHLLHRYAYWRGVLHTPEGREHRSSFLSGIPILMYHAFCVDERSASRYIMPVSRFQKQMEWLKRNRYHVLSLDELCRFRQENQLPPERAVVITIDDGYAETSSLAYPVLQQRGFPATVFLVSDRVGLVNDWDVRNELAERPLLSWADARDLQTGGVDFGAHTRTHCDLSIVPLQVAKEEVIQSRDCIQAELGRSVVLFSYPYGKHSSAISTMVEQAGFIGSVGTENGLNTLSTHLQMLRRVEIFGTDSLVQFALALRFGARSQILWKRVTRRFLPDRPKTIRLAK